MDWPTSIKRSSALPEVPTLAELGIQGVDVSTWFGIFAHELRVFTRDTTTVDIGARRP